jgi:hypothetical protein
MKTRRKLLASDLHSDVLDDLMVEENDTSLLNHQEFGDLLIDPDENTEFKAMRDTHGISASVKAGLADEFDDLDDDLLDDMPEDGLDMIESELDDLEEVDADDLLDEDDGLDPIEVLSAEETDVMPSDVDEQKKIETEDALDKTTVEENETSDVQRAGETQDSAVEEVTAADESEDKSEDKSEDEQKVEAEDESDDEKSEDKSEDEEQKVEAEDESDDEKSEDKSEDEQKVESAKKKVKAEEVELQNNQSDSKIEVDSSADYALVDVDCVDDGSCDDLLFATIDGTKHVIKSNRIIASMTADSAKVCGCGDVYLDDDFDEAVISECEAKGLRAGLRAMGFTLATVKIKSSAQLNASVARATANAKAEMVKAQDKRNEVMKQSLALAAVGLNRNMFKDYENELRSELTAKFESLGVRGASRIVKAAFAEYGVDYANKLLVIANEIADLPEETRDGLAAQLDMTNEPDEEIMADPNLYGDPVVGEGEDDEDEAVDSVEAALRNPLKALAAHKVKASVNKPLPFTIY